ncbi:hypothetical protein VYU27_004093 [Nannochloropsis oceanica]
MARSDLAHPLLVDSVTASREDLLALRTLLRAKLEEAKRDEKKMKLDLGDLRKKIQGDLKKVEARLRTA